MVWHRAHMSTSRTVPLLLSGWCGHGYCLHGRLAGFLNQSTEEDHLHSTRLATAYHEAGHAFAAYRLGIPIGRKGGSIVPGEDHYGWLHVPVALSNPTHGNSDAARVKAEKYAIVSLAGIETQRWHNPKSVRKHHAAGDFAHAADLMSRFVSSSEELNAYMRLLRIRAKNVVTAPAALHAISSLAEAFTSHRVLSKDQIAAAIRSSFQTRRESFPKTSSKRPTLCGDNKAT